MAFWAWGNEQAEQIRQEMDRMQRIEGAHERGPFGVSFNGPSAANWPFALDFNRGLPVHNSKMDEPYAQHANIANAIGILAEDMSSVPWAIFEKDTDAQTPMAVFGDINQNAPIKGHPLLALWSKPNDYMNGIQLFIGTYIAYWVFGEAWWYYPDVELPTGEPSAANRLLMRMGDQRLDLLDPRTILIKSNDGVTYEWYQRLQGVEKRLNPARLTQFKRWNPYNPLRGLSKITALIAEIEGDQAAAEWNKRFFSDQNGIPTGLLLPSQGSDPLNEQQEKSVLSKFNVRHGKRRTVGLLPAGWQWKDVGINQRDMEFPRLRDYSREQVYGLMQVPPFRAGVLDKANYANARQQDQVYWNGVIKRTLAYFKGVLDHDFLPKIGINDVTACPQWDLVRQMLEDFAAKAETAKVLHERGIPMTLINQKLNLGFDLTGVEGADEPWMLNNYVPVRRLLEDPVTSPASGDPAADASGSNDDEDEAVAASFVLALPAKELERRLRAHVHTIEQFAMLRPFNEQPGWSADKFDKDNHRRFQDIFQRALKISKQHQKVDEAEWPAAYSTLAIACTAQLREVGRKVVSEIVAAHESCANQKEFEERIRRISKEAKSCSADLAMSAMKDLYSRVAELRQKLTA